MFCSFKYRLLSNGLMIFLHTFLLFFLMSCLTVLCPLSFILIIVTLNNIQKTASSSSDKTILGKTFAGSSVNSCSVEPQSVLENLN